MWAAGIGNISKIYVFPFGLLILGCLLSLQFSILTFLIPVHINVFLVFFSE